MPVVFDSSAFFADSIGGGSTSGTSTFTHNVSTVARDDMVALVGVVFNTDVTLTSMTSSVTFGGVAMTQLGSSQYANSNRMSMRWYYLADPPTGTRTVQLSYSSMPTETGSRFALLVSGTWAGVDSTVTPTVTTNSGASTTSNTVTVTSVLPAHRVIALHGVVQLRSFTATGYNQQKRAGAAIPLFGSGAILMGDAPGAASVTSTAIHNSSTANWLAAGISLTPSVVDAGASQSFPVSLATAGGTYRQATPAPDRTWVIPADPVQY